MKAQSGDQEFDTLNQSMLQPATMLKKRVIVNISLITIVIFSHLAQAQSSSFNQAKTSLSAADKIIKVEIEEIPYGERDKLLAKIKDFNHQHSLARESLNKVADDGSDSDYLLKVWFYIMEAEVISRKVAESLYEESEDAKVLTEKFRSSLENSRGYISEMRLTESQNVRDRNSLLTRRNVLIVNAPFILGMNSENRSETLILLCWIIQSGDCLSPPANYETSFILELEYLDDYQIIANIKTALQSVHTLWNFDPYKIEEENKRKEFLDKLIADTRTSLWEIFTIQPYFDTLKFYFWKKVAWAEKDNLLIRKWVGKP